LHTESCLPYLCIHLPCRTVGIFSICGSIDSPQTLYESSCRWNLSVEMFLSLLLLNFQGKPRTQNTLKFVLSTKPCFRRLCSYFCLILNNKWPTTFPKNKCEEFLITIKESCNLRLVMQRRK